MNYQQQLANSAAIRAEIQRFESVHPNIYSIYELLERVDEPVLQNQIREHVIAIEGEDPAVAGFLESAGERARVCARVYTRAGPWHAAVRPSDHCGASYPARPARAPGEVMGRASAPPAPPGRWVVVSLSLVRKWRALSCPQSPE